jgi:hypothetical protein
MSTLPNASAAAATIASICAASRTSVRTASARPPAATISAATSWIVPGSRSVLDSDFAATTTAAPARARRSANARPMPRLAPVTIAVRPASGAGSCSMIASLDAAGCVGSGAN